ncbi:prolipoprotein diacylglyceryl transferase [Varunaivibrio sulfuroxidans]|uniref:Phosphatidylglycerol--prolipoprotein diacylglyceryl transferase n=1 Tax=Varunaivibrio sulfuroxidans TaxID=1773489 RepID=A0A4R3J508_9PROT|nr:prolipoprotein diacylglyceryl transferase [Varunaivibrio sulfuroxidans]TCS60898.1 phosphatidylglycerol:prolipoprotein diacylglycerol transferase [Varunaivibrio sulfuroxidans]WES31693.1 prolipoprotein diacylglyceryl transferase [Varunaivibrio sulfuroxidans]
MSFVIAFPNIDPVLVHLGPLAIRWYSLAYIVGILAGWRYMVGLAARPPYAATRAQIDDFIVWATLGVVLGGRTGYVLFYNLEYYAQHPLHILYVWEGGMSFHGGMIGVALAGYLFVRSRKIAFWPFLDLAACAAPIGLFFGRIANFINGELYGRVSDVPWAMVFPRGGPLPRHPSQLYESALEGFVLFFVLHFLWRVPAVRRRPGVLTGVFLAGYGLARASIEQFRQPDVQVGFLPGGTTMGQWLSAPMIVGGVVLIVYFLRRAPVPLTPRPDELQENAPKGGA